MDCQHVFTDGHWSDAALKIIFSKTHEGQAPFNDMEGQRYVSAEIVDKIVRTGRDNGRWLDVGFGNGSLMFTAAEYGFEPVGLDLRPDSVAAMNAVGFQTHCCDIADYQDDRFFEVISMADCLEHMPYPKKGLEAARQLIIRGGILFLSMPNFSSPLWGYLHQTNSNPYWGELEHYHNFSRERLFDLLRETRFQPINYGVSKRYRCCMEVVARAS